MQRSGTVSANDGFRYAASILRGLKQFSSVIEQDVFSVLTLEGSVAARNHIGGTAPNQVREAVKWARRPLENV